MKKSVLVAVVAVFFLPVVIAVLLHSRWLDWQPGETRNHGELIEPVIALPEFRFTGAGGRPLARADLIERWQLILYQPGECGEDCLQSAYWLRQIRRAQDRHRPEIGLLVVTDAALDESTLERILELDPAVRVLAGDDGRRFSRWLPDNGEAPIRYIADPLGNIILRYPEAVDANGMRRDLQRLLTWTQTDQGTA